MKKVWRGFEDKITTESQRRNDKWKAKNVLTDYFVIVRQTIELESMKIEKNMMTLSYAVRISMSVGSSALEILAADETSVNVDSRKRNRAQFFEIKV